MKLPPLPAHPDVSVVIPARNSGTTLARAVRSALGQEVPGQLEVVIAVAPSDDDTGEVAVMLAAADDRVRVVDNPVGTTPAALNNAIGASTGDVIARLDGHAELTDGYLARAVELLRETGAANVGGVQLPVAEGGFAAAVAAAMRSPFGSGGARYRLGGDPEPTDTVYLGVFHRDALQVVGGYDERLLRNQDYELNHRIRDAGGIVYFHPDLVVRYRPRGDARSLARQYFAYGAWKRRVLRMHPRSAKARQLIPPAFVLGLVGTAAMAAAGGPRWPLIGVAGSYLTTSTVAAATSTNEPRLVPATVTAFAVMHTAWGLGFLVGRTGER